MAQIRAYNHKEKHESLTPYKIMIPSNTKHTDWDRIDKQENELRIDIEEYMNWKKKNILGEDNVYTKQREITQIDIVTV